LFCLDCERPGASTPSEAASAGLRALSARGRRRTDVMGALLSEPVAAMVVERSSAQCWSAATATMQGWRRTHEDAHVLQCAVGGPEEAAVFAVLDGHGGSACATSGALELKERLSAIARRGTLGAKTAEEELRRAFVEIDARLRQRLPPEERSGSTVVAAIVTQPKPSEYSVHMAHAGDSRAVLCTCGGKQLVCSEDHKPQREDERARICAAGGSVEHGPLGGGPLRVDGALAVSRSFGDFGYKTVGGKPEECKITAVPEVRTVSKCMPGDWLLLACDGVFDVMSNEDVRDFVSSRVAGKGDPPDGGAIAVELLAHCLEKGSKDNCTACLVQFLDGRGRTTQASRELLQGPWRTASPGVQQKYADFFSAEGFEAEAEAVRRQSATALGVAEPASGRGGAATLAKVLQALRSTRAIQSAWRARQSGREEATDGRGAALPGSASSAAPSHG